MKSNWVRAKIKDYVDINPKTPLKKGRSAPKVAMENLVPFQKHIDAWNSTTFNGGSRFINGDTLMARITPCLENGKTAFVDFLPDQTVGFGSTEFIVFRAIPGLCDPDYLYYLTISPNFRAEAIKSMVGSSGRQRVQVGVLENYEHSFPSIAEQKAIADVLSSLDRKIIINIKINDYLDQLLVSLFQEKILKPGEFESWKQLRLTEIANFKNGLAMQKYRPSENDIGLPVLKIKELGAGKVDENTERCSSKIDHSVIVNDGDVVFSWSGTLLVDLWCGGTVGLNQHLFKVTSETFPKWFYFVWIKHHLKTFIALATAKATTMGHIKRGDLEASYVFLPPESKMKELSQLFSPLIEKIIINKIENSRLEDIRDNLLPRLLSGEVSIG